MKKLIISLVLILCCFSGCNSINNTTTDRSKIVGNWTGESNFVVIAGFYFEDDGNFSSSKLSLIYRGTWNISNGELVIDERSPFHNTNTYTYQINDTTLILQNTANSEVWNLARYS